MKKITIPVLAAGLLFAACNNKTPEPTIDIIGAHTISLHHYGYAPDGAGSKPFDTTYKATMVVASLETGVQVTISSPDGGQERTLDSREAQEDVIRYYTWNMQSGETDPNLTFYKKTGKLIYSRSLKTGTNRSETWVAEAKP